MNFFENELKKICGSCDTLSDKRYVGRACIGRIDENITAKIEFVTLGVADQYTALRASVINRNEGKIDSLTIRLKEIMSDHDPHIWDNYGNFEWYGYKLTAADYKSLSESVDSYLEAFAPVEEMGMKMY